MKQNSAAVMLPLQKVYSCSHSNFSNEVPWGKQSECLHVLTNSQRIFGKSELSLENLQRIFWESELSFEKSHRLKQ